MKLLILLFRFKGIFIFVYMSETKVLIVGAGAAGLMAGRELSRAGYKVTILEAADRCGGRIFDINDPLFPSPVMLGAEFVHGRLPLTIDLLKEAGIHFYPAEGKSVKLSGGKLERERDGNENWPLLIERLRTLKEDISLTGFLDNFFSGEGYAPFRESVLNFARGFDAADPGKVSALSLLTEWEQDEQEQYRVEGGYGRLISFLESECNCYGCSVRLGTRVKHIKWQKGKVEVFTTAGDHFTAQKLVITVPVGILKVKEEEENSIIFDPPLIHIRETADAMGFGGVIKVILHFRDQFWEPASGSDAAFIFSDEKFPTWWTQLPKRLPVLTGWLGGPDTEYYRDATDSEILATALKSLSAIFGISTEQLNAGLLAWKVCNWSQNSFVKGAYTYPTTLAPDAAKILLSPVEDTLYFAGEAAYEGAHGGTVEAALTSAKGIMDREIYNSEPLLHNV